jgi:hypothetical protein
MPKVWALVDNLWQCTGETDKTPVVSDPIGPEPDPDPPNPTWLGALAASQTAQTTTAIRTWYEANTGHTAIGYVTGTPGVGETQLVAGSLTSAYDGQVIEGIVGSHIRVSHDNVTYRGCRIEGGGTYGAYLNPTFGAAVTGLRIEYTTFYYGLAAPDNDKKTPVQICPAYTANSEPDVVISHCEAYDWSAGFGVRNKVRVEYCYIHDFQHPPGVHANSIRPAFDGGEIYRNYCTDGRSGVISIYFDKEPTHNITIEENIMSGESPLASPSYLTNLKDGAYSAGATGIKIINNWWHDGWAYGIFSGTPDLPWGTNGNVRSGNKMLMTGELVAND